MNNNDNSREKKGEQFGLNIADLVLTHAEDGCEHCKVLIQRATQK